MFDFLLHIVIIGLQVFTLAILLGKNPMEQLSKDAGDNHSDAPSAENENTNLAEMNLMNSKLFKQLLHENFPNSTPSSFIANLKSLHDKGSLFKDLETNSKKSFLESTSKKRNREVEKDLKKLTEEGKNSDNEKNKIDALDSFQKSLGGKDKRTFDASMHLKKDQPKNSDELKSKDMKVVSVLSDKSGLISDGRLGEVESFGLNNNF